MYDHKLLEIAYASTLLFALFAFFIVRFAIRHKNQQAYDRLERERLLHELEMKELTMAFGERELMLEEVSQELHDNLGQLACLIRMNLYNIEDYCTGDEQGKIIKYVADLTDMLVNDIQYISKTLSMDFIKDMGLYHMLEFNMDQINAGSKIRCSIHVEGDHKILMPEPQLLVYRIAQEAIRNALQHASAKNIYISLFYRSAQFKMDISDDGMGFDLSKINEAETLGIGNMRKRANVLNGTLEIQSDYGKGCIVALSVDYGSTA
jgi:hypothetical protein